MIVFVCYITQISIISNMKNQLTEKDKDHNSKINAVNEKLKIAEENVKAMKTEIEKQKATFVHEEKQIFKCNACDAQFTSNKTLEVHVKSDHETNRKRKFENENKDTKKRKRFTCEICGASYSINGDLTRHIKIVHEGIKSYKCKLCGEDFGYGHELKRHENSKHAIEKEAFPCTYCNLKLSRKDKKKEHEIICSEKKR